MVRIRSKLWMLAIVAGSVVPPGCVDSGDQPAGSNGYDTDCDTDAPPATTGGGYGTPWEEPGGFPDMGEQLLDVGALPPEDDPLGWEHDSSTDLYYRSPTADELVDNEWWTSEHLLVIPDAFTLRYLTGGTTTVSLSLPLHDPTQSRPQQGLDIHTDDVERQATHSSIPFIERRVEFGSSGWLLTRSTVQPDFHFYVTDRFDPQDIEGDDIIISGFAATRRDSLALHGVSADRQFWLYGPYSTADSELEIALPTGKSQFYMLATRFDPAPGNLISGGSPLMPGRAGPGHLSQNATVQTAAIAQCDDGYDNDDDSYADVGGCDFACVPHPDFRTDQFTHDVVWEASKNIGMFGAVEFCTRHQDAYLSMYMMWATDGTQLLNWVEPADPPMGYDPAVRPPPFRVMMRGCIIDDSVEDAQACDRQDDCSPALASYPLGGLSGNWPYASGGVMSKVWDLVEFTIGNGDVDDTRPIQTAVVFPFEYDMPMEGGGEPGLATVYDPEAPGVNGSAIVRWDTDLFPSNQGGTAGALAHEVGHTVGLGHDTSTYPGTNFASFMNAIGGVAPVLDWDGDSDINNVEQGEVWQQLAPSKFVPRPSGFKHRDCDQVSCNNGHPGLVCDDFTYCFYN